MANDKARGSQFDTLDKYVAGRAQELLSRDTLTFQDVQEWKTDYDLLAQYGRSNSDNTYVARQWSDEEKRYANVVSWMMSKVKSPVKYTPRLYNEDLPLGRCNCTSLTDKSGGSDSTILPRRGTDLIPSHFQQPSVGDAIKNFFGLPETGHYATPQVNTPLSNREQIPTSNIFQYVLLAAVVGGILYAVYKVRKRA
jgi:hypothetical protein